MKWPIVVVGRGAVPSAAGNEWPEVSRLLDAALDLVAHERAGWLAALPETPAKAMVARLLAQQAQVESANFLATLPHLSPAALRAFGALEGNPMGGLPQAGDEVGPWRLLRELGQGGMGAVWLAERSDGQLKRTVALKLPRAAWTGLSERLGRERDILASLEHANIARLYDAGVDASRRPWLAIEYVEGQPIDEHVRRESLDTRAVLGLLLQVVAAVAHAHSRLVIHRDLKPSNILVTARGQVRLLDFGIAKLLEGERTQDTALTRADGHALTLDYASPEQIRCEPLTTASDVYSLAVVAYELLSGQRPHVVARGSAAKLEEAIANDDPPLASQRAATEAARRALRGDLDAILNKALKKLPAERYSTVEAMGSDIERYLAGDAVSARPNSAWFKLRRLLLRERRLLGAGAVVLSAFAVGIGAGATALVILALLTGLAAALWQARRARQGERAAQAQAARAQAVQAFLIDVFSVNTDQQADPKAARQTTARELLDRGAERVETALQDAPEARVEVLATLGRMYHRMALYEESVAIGRRLVALLRQLCRGPDRRLAQALVNLAGALHATRWRDEIVPLLQDAECILDALGEHDSVLRGELMSTFAQRQQTISAAAMKHSADGAVQVLRRHAAGHAVELAGAMHLAARARLLLGDLAESERLHAECETLLVAQKPPPHVALAHLRGSYIECLTLQHRYGDALALAQRAADDSEHALGIEDGNALFLASRLGILLHASGRRAEGRARLQQRLDLVLRVRGTGAFFCPNVSRRDLAAVLYSEGDLAGARPLLDAAIEAMQGPYAGSQLLAAAWTQWAQVAAAMGEIEEAERRLDEAMSMLVANLGLGSAPDARASRLLLPQARLDLDCGRASAALAKLDRIVDVPGPQLALPCELLEAALLRSRALEMLDDRDGALAMAERTAANIAASPAPRELPALQANGQLQWSLALLAAGRAAEALAPASAAARWRGEHDHPASPWAAQAEITLASVLYTLGHGAEARAALARAEARHAANERLAEHWRVPLRDLQLRMRSP